MKERVDVREWIEFQWPYLMAFVGGKRRVSELAYETGAFTRARKIKSPEVLLRLIFMWAVGERSVMDTPALAIRLIRATSLTSARPASAAKAAVSITDRSPTAHMKINRSRTSGLLIFRARA